MLGETEFAAFEESLTSDRQKALSVNLFRMDKGEFLQRAPFSLTPVPWCRNGYFYKDVDQPGKHPMHEAGLYYIQEPSAMAVGQLLMPEPGDRILDLCAAPGGKSFAVWLSKTPDSLMIANEIHPQRVKALAQNCERMGMGDTVVLNETPLGLAKRFPSFFDRILVDAPCSGEGMFRKEEEAPKQWSLELVRECAVRQEEILDLAVQMLSPGGRLVYSTCTFAPDEDEYQVLRLLREYPELHMLDAMELTGTACGTEPEQCGFVRGSADYLQYTVFNNERGTDLQDISESEKQSLEMCVRLFPHKVKGEGHFAAVLEKDGKALLRDGYRKDRGTGKKDAKRKGTENALTEAVKLWERFSAAHLSQPAVNRLVPEGRTAYHLFGEMLYACPAGLSLDGLKTVKPGLCLGMVRKGRFEPEHALCMAMKAGEYRYSMELQPDRGAALAFFRGESLHAGDGRINDAGGEKDPDPDWIMLTYAGAPAGFGKLDRGSGIIKNRYPTGLRKVV